jgi:hypothetical protein
VLVLFPSRHVVNRFRTRVLARSETNALPLISPASLREGLRSAAPSDRREIRCAKCE